MFDTPTSTDRRLLPSTVRVSVGTLLVVAACLKIPGQNYSPVPQIGWLSITWVNQLTTLWEMVLGIWLIFGLASSIAWVFTFWTFTVFACVSGWLGWIGQSSCKCFGNVEINPWFVFSLDLFVLGALILTKPKWIGLKNESREHAGVFLRLAAIAFVVFAGLTVSNATGLTSRAKAQFLGQPLVTLSQRIDFGTQEPGEIVEREVEIQNLGDSPINLIGGTNACSFQVIGMPMTLAPGETVAVKLNMRVPKSNSGLATFPVELWTNLSTQPKVYLTCELVIP